MYDIWGKYGKGENDKESKRVSIDQGQKWEIMLKKLNAMFSEYTNI